MLRFESDQASQVTRHDERRQLPLTAELDRFQPFAVVDYGDGQRWDVLLPESGDTFRLDTEQFMSLAWADGVSQVVGGAEHLQRPRVGKSLAQPLTSEQISALVDDGRFYLFPDSMNTTILRFLLGRKEIKKEDKNGRNDCLATRKWLLNRPTRCPPLKLLQRESEWYDEFKLYNHWTNQLLNATRYDSGKSEYDCGMIRKQLNQLAWRFEHVSQKSRFTVMACFVDPTTGEPRTFRGRLVSRRFAYNYLVGSPFGKGSVARSNIMFHWWRNSLGIRDPRNSSSYIPIGLMDDKQHKWFTNARSEIRRGLRALISECIAIRDGSFVAPQVGDRTPNWRVEPIESEQLDLFALLPDAVTHHDD